MELDLSITLLALLVGFFLNEIRDVFRGIREDRRALAQALSDLLEVYEMNFGRKVAIENWLKEPDAPTLSDEKRSALWTRHVNQPAALSERYESAVTEISRSAPILASRLRDRAVAIVSSTMPKEKSDEYKHYIQLVNRHFDDRARSFRELILEVARRHGLLTWCRTFRKLQTPPRLNDFGKDLLNEILLKKDLEETSTN